MTYRVVEINRLDVELDQTATVRVVGRHEGDPTTVPWEAVAYG